MRLKNFIGIIVCLIVVLIRIFWDNLFFWKNIGKKKPWSNVFDFSLVKLAVVRRQFPELVSKKVVDVQPIKTLTGLDYALTTDYSEMKMESDGSLVASGKTLKEPILEATPIKGTKIKTKKELYEKWGDNDGFMEVTNPEIKKILQTLIDNQEKAEKGSFHNLPLSPITGAPHTGKVGNVEFEGGGVKDPKSLIKKIFSKGINVW